MLKEKAKVFFEKCMNFFRFFVIYLRDNLKRLPAVMVMQVLLPAIFYGLQYMYLSASYTENKLKDLLIYRGIVIVLAIALFLIMLWMYRVVHTRMGVLHRAYYMVGIDTRVIAVAVALQSAVYATCGLLVGMALYQLVGIVSPQMIAFGKDYAGKTNAILWASYVISAVATNLLAMRKKGLLHGRSE